MRITRAAQIWLAKYGSGWLRGIAPPLHESVDTPIVQPQLPPFLSRPSLLIFKPPGIGHRVATTATHFSLTPEIFQNQHQSPLQASWSLNLIGYNLGL